MFERYTEKARRVIFFARYEASQYGSPHIETEHMLLGLMREDHKLALRFLSEKGGAQSIRDEIEAHIERRERISTSVEVPLTVECKRILNLAAEEAERLGSKHVGTEHLLLGILREEKCFAASLLHERGLTLTGLREGLRAESGQEATDSPGDVLFLSKLVDAWSLGNAPGFARFFGADGQLVDPQGNLSVGPALIVEAANRIFKSPGWAPCTGKIDDISFVGPKAVMVSVSWTAAEPSEQTNPGCVCMTVILIQKREGWSIARVQATGLQPKSRSAAV
jgi:uncharacterized protein (TIGR02246 family)